MLHARVPSPEFAARDPDFRFERHASFGALVLRRVLQIVELLLDLLQFGDDVVDQGGPDRLRDEFRADGAALARDLLFMFRARLLADARIVQLDAKLVDAAPVLLDAVEGAQHRRDVLLLQFAAFRQQDQFGRRITLAAHPLGQREQRLNGVGNVAQRCGQVALRLLDALAERHFFVRLQQLSSTDVLEVDADQIDVLATNTWFETLLLFLLGFFLVFLAFDVFFHVLRDEGFRLIVLQSSGCFDAERNRLLVLVFGHREPEFLSAMVPVEDVRLPGRIVPLDQ